MNEDFDKLCHAFSVFWTAEGQSAGSFSSFILKGVFSGEFLDYSCTASAWVHRGTHDAASATQGLCHKSSSLMLYMME